MKRGDIVTVARRGDCGKPRPAVIIESDLLPPSDSVLVCLISSTPHGEGTYRRQGVEASSASGLRLPSQIMVDKIIAVPRTKCGGRIGMLDAAAMRALTRKIAVLVGIED